MPCDTVQVQTAPSADNPTGVVVINREDLTDEHVLVGAEPTKEVDPPAPPVPPAPEPIPEPAPAPAPKPVEQPAAPVEQQNVVVPPWGRP